MLCDNPKNGAAQRPSVVAPVLLHAHQRMENDTRTIKEVVKTVRDPGGEEIAIVRCSDGTYGVARDGKLIEMLRWDPSHLDQCVEFFERFARTS